MIEATGDVIWKLGGKQNDFSFLNENEANSPDYFSYQHNISVLPNGNLTLFDNGNQHSPQHSRAVEYKIDEVNKTADMVWEYRHTPDIYSMAMGSVQRLSNGNTLIGWGSAGMNGDPSVVEVHPDKSIAFELTLPKGETSYRAFRFPWASQQPAISVTNYEILQGNTYDFNDTNDTTGISIKVNQIDGLAYTSLTGTLYKYAPENPHFNSDAPLIAKEYFTLSQSSINSFEGEVHLKIKYHSKIIDPQNTIAYLKAEGDNTFKPLATSYSSSQNELIFTTTQFGDFVFGIPVNVDSVYAPILLSPKNEELVNEKDTVNLVWGTKGIVSEYQLQVSSDSLFSSIIFEDTLSSTSFELGELNNNTKYYWRLKANNSAGESEWSETFNFVAASPYVSIIYPNGNEEFFGDTTYIIRWQDNLSDTLNISLFKNDDLLMVIADSVVSATKAYSWQVPSSLAKDSLYKIRVTSVSDTNLYDLSDKNFYINTDVTAADTKNNVVTEYKLYQNYPNPV